MCVRMCVFVYLYVHIWVHTYVMFTWRPESTAQTHKLYQLHSTRSPSFLFLNAFFLLKILVHLEKCLFSFLYVYAICNDLHLMVKAFDPDVEAVLIWALSSALWDGQVVHPQAGCLLLLSLSIACVSKCDCCM